MEIRKYSINEELIFIKNGLSKPANKHEKRFYDYLCELIAQHKRTDNDFIEFETGEEFGNWVDEDMQFEFENDILEETGEETLQDVFTDSYYSSIQAVRDAMKRVEDKFINKRRVLK